MKYTIIIILLTIIIILLIVVCTSCKKEPLSHAEYSYWKEVVKANRKFDKKGVYIHELEFYDRYFLYKDDLLTNRTGNTYQYIFKCKNCCYRELYSVDKIPWNLKKYVSGLDTEQELLLCLHTSIKQIVVEGWSYQLESASLIDDIYVGMKVVISDKDNLRKYLEGEIEDYTGSVRTIRVQVKKHTDISWQPKIGDNVKITID